MCNSPIACLRGGLARTIDVDDRQRQYGPDQSTRTDQRGPINADKSTRIFMVLSVRIDTADTSTAADVLSLVNERKSERKSLINKDEEDQQSIVDQPIVHQHCFATAAAIRVY